MSKVVLVAGASCSLGNLLCLQLASLGYIVYAGYNSHPFPRNISKSIYPMKLDITRDASCLRTIKEIVKKRKKLDAVINLVGISLSGHLEKSSTVDFQRLLNINSVGAFRLMKTAEPFIPKSGKIINVGSICGIIGFPNFSLYSASKAALRAMTLAVSIEWLPKKKYVTLISPGGISKPVPQKMSGASARERIPFLKWLLPLVSQRQVVEKIVRVLDEQNPPFEVLIGRDTLLITFFYRFLPSRVLNTIQSYVWQNQQ